MNLSVEDFNNDWDIFPLGQTVSCNVVVVSQSIFGNSVIDGCSDGMLIVLEQSKSPPGEVINITYRYF